MNQIMPIRVSPVVSLEVRTAHRPNQLLILDPSSATFHLRLKTELFKLSYPDSTHAPSHVRNHHRLSPYSIQWCSLKQISGVGFGFRRRLALNLVLFSYSLNLVLFSYSLGRNKA